MKILIINFLNTPGILEPPTKQEPTGDQIQIGITISLIAIIFFILIYILLKFKKAKK